MNNSQLKNIPSTITTLASSISPNIKEYERIAWVGGMCDEEMARPGALLMGALMHHANERGQHLKDMARELGVTYAYINHLRNGLRSIKSISDELVLACAMYLSVPRHTIQMMSGKITPSDMFESEEIKACQITNAMSFVVNDPEWGPLVTHELRKSSLESQYCLVRLYEKATNKVLMDGHLNTNSLSLEISRLTALQAKWSQLRDTEAVLKIDRVNSVASLYP